MSELDDQIGAANAETRGLINAAIPGTADVPTVKSLPPWADEVLDRLLANPRRCRHLAARPLQPSFVGSGRDGLLFSGVRGGQLAESTYCRVWRRARSAALSSQEAASPLARRPYDLRHAAVSTWLNAGVPPTQVAAWAGHSVAVLLQIYAKCIAGQEEAARRRIDAALGGNP